MSHTAPTLGTTPLPASGQTHLKAPSLRRSPEGRRTEARRGEEL